MVVAWVGDTGCHVCLQADVRSRQRPAMLLVENVPRRFGHAATDRQIAYTEEEEILRHENANPLGVMCVQAVRAKYTTFEELTEMMEDLQARVEVAFDKAGAEPKLTDRQHLLDRVSAPLVPLPESAVVPPQRVSANGGSDNPSALAFGHWSCCLGCASLTQLVVPPRGQNRRR